jgi:uncharacterized membrane protein
MRKLLLAGVVSLVAALGSTTGADAWFKFNNKTNVTVWVAFQWFSPSCAAEGKWRTKGWWKLLPGQTKTVFGSDLQSASKYYYWYAEGGGLVWAGPFNTCVPNTAFEWCLNICCTPTCRTLGFREKYIGSYNNYTINLVK